MLPPSSLSSSETSQENVKNVCFLLASWFTFDPEVMVSTFN
jgi:hypothetical protein